MKILFLSRAYPPITGGIENQNAALAKWLPRYAFVRTIANRHGKKALPLFLPLVTVRALLTAYRYDVILLGDGVLAIMGFFIKLLYPKKPVVAVVHGLDLTYTNSVYQTLWVRRFIPSLDALIAVSHETRAVAIAKNIPQTKITVIPNGIETETLRGTYARQDTEALLGESIAGKHVLLTTGRLAKRKGAAWFIREVLPQLPKTIIYVLAGAGPDEKNIRMAIQMSGMKTRVRMLGRVSDAQRNILLNTADLFIQPNIVVRDDIEGFGIAAIEAATCGRVVIAADVEGLRDAITDGKNGFLVASGNTQAWVDKIATLTADPEARASYGKNAHLFTHEQFHWRKIARIYYDTLKKIIPEK